MGDYTRKLGKGEKTHGDKPDQEGIGFECTFLEIPGQENSDDPVMLYKAHDRYDNGIVISGVEVKSKAKETANRQLWLLAKVVGLTDPLVETEHTTLPLPPEEGETQDETRERLGLEEACAKLGKEIGSKMPKGVGFAFLMFGFGPGQNIAYISNANRSDMLATMREFLAKHGALNG